MTDENKNNSDNERRVKKRGIERSLHPRFDYLDQYRGALIVFYIIASLMWIFSFLNLGDPSELGPIWLNFGSTINPNLINIIDLGMTIFLFIAGISLTISFKANLEKKGARYAWMKVIQRTFAFIFLGSFIDISIPHFDLIRWILIGVFGAITIASIILRNLKKYRDTIYRPLIGAIWALLSIVLVGLVAELGKGSYFNSGHIAYILFGLAGPTYYPVILHGFTYLAWVTLFSALFVHLIKKPDYRIIISCILLIIHAVLWEFESVISTNIQTFWPQWEIPFNVLGMIGVAVAGTCVYDWMKVDPENRKIGLKKRIVPLLLIAGIMHFVVDFFQPAGYLSREFNVSIIFLALAFGTLLFIVFYLFESVLQFRIPVLSSLGRNSFLMVMCLPFYYQFFINIDEIGLLGPRIFLSNLLGVGSPTHPLVNLIALLVFIIPIVLISFIAWVLDKLRLHARL